MIIKIISIKTIQTKPKHEVEPQNSQAVKQASPGRNEKSFTRRMIWRNIWIICMFLGFHYHVQYGNAAVSGKEVIMVYFNLFSYFV